MTKIQHLCNNVCLKRCKQPIQCFKSLRNHPMKQQTCFKLFAFFCACLSVFSTFLQSTVKYLKLLQGVEDNFAVPSASVQNGDKPLRDQSCYSAIKCSFTQRANSKIKRSPFVPMAGKMSKMLPIQSLNVKQPSLKAGKKCGQLPCSKYR